MCQLGKLAVSASQLATASSEAAEAAKYAAAGGNDMTSVSLLSYRECLGLCHKSKALVEPLTGSWSSASLWPKGHRLQELQITLKNEHSTHLVDKNQLQTPSYLWLCLLDIHFSDCQSSKTFRKPVP